MHKYKQIPNDEKLKEKLLSRYRESENGCWEWIGTTLSTGYGVLRHNLGYKNNKTYLSHRVSYHFFKEDKLIDGLVVDHICNNPSCVNPNHLRQLTIYENVLRVLKNKSRNRVNFSLPSLLFKGVCKHGHPINSFDDMRTVYVKSESYYRYDCRQCSINSARKYKRKTSPK